MNLFDWQVPYAEQVQKIFTRRSSALLVIPPGGGKTYIASELVRRGVFRRPYHLVLCPKSVISTWQKVLSMFNSQAIVMNYEQLTSHSNFAKSGELGDWWCTSTKKDKHGKVKKRVWAWEWEPDMQAEGAIIFDEAHRCKGRELRAEALLLAAKAQGIPHLMMTATPPDNPLDMRGFGVSLDLFQRSLFWDWALSHGVRRSYVHDGFEFPMYSERTRAEAEEHLDRINKRIFPECGVCMTHEELRKFYPQGHIYLSEVDIPETEAFKTKYADEIEELRKAVEDCELRLVEELRIHQELEFAKIEVFMEEAKELLASGHSVVIFVCYRKTAEYLAEELKASLIIGNQSAVERQAAIDNFQSNKEKCMVLTVSAGSEAISLHDLDGRHPRVSLLSPIWNPVVLKQALGRIHRAGGKSAVTQKILVSSGFEEKIYRRCLQRLRNMGALTADDGFNLETE